MPPMRRSPARKHATNLPATVEKNDVFPTPSTPAPSDAAPEPAAAFAAISAAPDAPCVAALPEVAAEKPFVIVCAPDPATCDMPSTKVSDAAWASSLNGSIGGRTR